jgi:hypothetical protein
MTAPIKPAPAKLYGRSNYYWLPALSGYSAGTGPTVAEMTAGLDITNILFADGEPPITQSTNLVEQAPRYGDTVVSQFVGRTTMQGGEAKYSFDPQAIAGSDPKKFWELIKNVTGTVTGFLVRRDNVPINTAPTAGQFVFAVPAEAGPSLPGKDGDGEAAEGAAMVTIAITGAPLAGGNVAIVA